MHTNIHGASPTLSIYLCFLRPVTVVHPGAFAQRTAHHHQDSLTTTIHQSNNPTIHLPIYQTTNTSYTHPFTHSLTHSLQITNLKSQTLLTHTHTHTHQHTFSTTATSTTSTPQNSMLPILYHSSITTTTTKYNNTIPIQQSLAYSITRSLIHRHILLIIQYKHTITITHL